MSSAPNDPNGGQEILIEFFVYGNSVKATAIDPQSGEEASIVGPTSASRAMLAEAARRKLEYVLKKKSAG
jgi:hypothetical protein